MAKSSFGRIGARSRRGTFFIVTGIVLVMTLITLLGMRLPVPGFGVQTVYGVQDIRKGIDINGGRSSPRPPGPAMSPTPNWMPPAALWNSGWTSGASSTGK